MPGITYLVFVVETLLLLLPPLLSILLLKLPLPLPPLLLILPIPERRGQGHKVRGDIRPGKGKGRPWLAGGALCVRSIPGRPG